MTAAKVIFFKNDLPENVTLTGDIAVDTEAMGLNLARDRLCLVQLSDSSGQIYLVQIDKGQTAAPNLQKILSSPAICKIFHFARFDVAALYKQLGITVENIFCTKIASKLVRTYTDSHGLKELCRELLNVQLSKQQQSSDWGSSELTKDQQIYASSDVLYLHQLKEHLIKMLIREERLSLATACFSFIKTRAMLDLKGWDAVDIFAHH